MCNLLTRDHVAQLFGIQPESVRSTLRRAGIAEHRGYCHEEVMTLLNLRKTQR